MWKPNLAIVRLKLPIFLGNMLICPIDIFTFVRYKLVFDIDEPTKSSWQITLNLSTYVIPFELLKIVYNYV